jgi:dUTPase
MSEIPVFKFALREDLVNEPQFLPTKGEPMATGWDVRAAQPDRKDLIIRPGQYVKIPMGFRCFCPEGWWYSFLPRSSSFAKKSLHCLTGTIDFSYEDQLLLAAQFLPDVCSLGKELNIKFGEALGQIIPYRLQNMEVNSISNEEFEKLCKERNGTRKGGFGSTTKA